MTKKIFLMMSLVVGLFAVGSSVKAQDRRAEAWKQSKTPSAERVQQAQQQSEMRRQQERNKQIEAENRRQDAEAREASRNSRTNR